MSAIAGAISLNGRPLRPETLVLLDQGLERFGSDAFLRLDSHVAMIYRRFATTPEEDREPYFHDDPGRILAAFTGRIDNGAELLVGATDLDIVLHVYDQNRDPACMITGDFALAIWDAQRQRLLLSRDMFGAYGLFYCVTDGMLCWASHLDPLIQCYRGELHLDDSYIAQYLNDHPDPARTPFRELIPVPPAHSLVLEGRKFSIVRWWRPRITVDERASDSDRIEQCFSTFRRAVEARLRTNSKAVALLSGGLDSASLVCMADQIEDGRVETATFGFEAAAAADERAYAKAVESKRRKSGFHLIEDRAPILSLQPDPGFVAFPAPLFCFGGRIIQLVDLLRDLGARTILSGWGGDEVFLGIRRWVCVLSDRLVERRFRQFCQDVRAWASAVDQPIPRLISQSVIRPLLGLRPVYANPSRLRWLPLRLQNLAKQPLEFEFLSSGVDGRKRSHLRLIARTIQPVAAGYGCLPTTLGLFDFRMPFLDRQLVEFVLSQPNDEFQRPTENRSLLRRAMVGTVPELIRTRMTKQGPSAAFARALRKPKSILDVLLDGSRAHSMGFFDSGVVRDTATRISYGSGEGISELSRALSLEIWLRNLESFRSRPKPPQRVAFAEKVLLKEGRR